MTGANVLPSEASDRMARLLDAVQAVGSDLDLQVVLRRIVEAAVSLVGAKYGALGVVDEGRSGLSEFITIGIDEAGVSQIGAPPAGHGVLGELLRDPRPLRLTVLADHPTSSGFPPNHPPMDGFLGVPVRVGQEVFGNLYLTEKRDGLYFTAEDEKVVVALAVAAGVALKNSRLYEESRRRGAWMEAGKDISTSLLSGTEREDVIALVVQLAREVLGADVSFMALVDDDALHVETASGCDGPALLAQLAQPLAEVLASGQTRDVVAGPLSGAAVPLGPTGRPCTGVLVVLWTRRPDPWVTTDLTGFAAQAAIALELAERRGEVERYAILQDRDRIGRDLHDLVIQRLFAIGMQLQGSVRLNEQNPVEAMARVNRAVDELDETIRELRSTIYGLQAPLEGRPSLRAQVLQVVDVATRVLGFAPTVVLDGLIDTLTTPALAEHAVATLRESLSNVARHAKASRVSVLVAVRGSTFQLRVQDDGIGIASADRRSGLDNLASRAEELGGYLKITSPPGEGATLLWVVPL